MKKGGQQTSTPGPWRAKKRAILWGGMREGVLGGFTRGKGKKEDSFAKCTDNKRGTR